MKLTQRVLVAIILATASGALAGERPTADELLAVCKKSFEKLSRVRIECTEERPNKKPPADGVSDWTRDLTILRDASRWKVDQVQRGTRVVDGQKVAAGFWHQTLVGDEVIDVLLFNPPPQDPQSRPIVAAFRDPHAHRVWSMIHLARVVFGYMEGDSGLPLWTVMGEDTKLELLPKSEKMAGIQTWVLKSRGKYGEHKVWFDPANGGLPRRIEIRKQIGDLLNDEQLGSRPAEDSVPVKAERGRPGPPTAMQEVFIRIDNIQIENKDGFFVITAFDYDSRQTMMKAQKEIAGHMGFRTRTIEVDPKPWPEEAFQFDIKIPNGLRVGIFVNVPLEFGSAVADTYEDWVDGKLQKRPGQ